MNPPKHPDLADFEAWTELARSDPGAFESARRAALNALLEQAPPRHRKRLEGLQWRIDRIREHSDNPMSACVQLSRMMWDQVLGPSGLVEQIRRLSEPGKPPAPAPRAQVIPFTRRGGRDD